MTETSYPIPFIIGASRSGTTLLRLMLDSHPDLAIPPETHFISIVARKCDGAANPHRMFVETITQLKQWPDFTLDKSDLTAAVDAIRPFDLRRAIVAFYDLWKDRAGKPRWGDKTPAYALAVDLIHDLFPEAHFIHLVRDGRDVAISSRAVWFGQSAPAEAAYTWIRHVEGARRASRFPHYLEIRYEDLILNCAPTLRRVCDFIDLSWDPVMLDYHQTARDRLASLNHEMRSPKGALLATPEERMQAHLKSVEKPDASRVFQWKAMMAAADRSGFEDVAGWLLDELGYDVDGEQEVFAAQKDRYAMREMARIAKVETRDARRGGPLRRLWSRIRRK